MQGSVRFGRFEVQRTQRKLLCDGRVLAVGARAFDLLLALIDRPDRLVTKSELLDFVWPGLVVEEANIQVQVSALRRLLGADAIATVPGFGYRFALAAETPIEAPARSGAPAPAEAAVAWHNLPAAVASLIGRDDDVAALAAALATQRLVTVLGPGGIGKTRVAQEVARGQVGLHANGVWWVDLAGLAGADHLVAAVANAANLTLGDGRSDLSEMLARSLAPRRTLLVLDNCERLVDAVGQLSATLLRAAPGVRLLVTSQEVLHVLGELVYRLEPLAVPPPHTPLGEARRFSAVQLLEQRAQAADRHFAVGTANVDSVITLLGRLDGLPLAIEMAAARIPLLGLTSLSERFDEWSRLLRQSGQGVPMRQQTLQSMLEWSHSLLAPQEQSVLRQLAAFAGSFCVDTAQQALAGPGLDEWAVLEALSALVDKSLVQVERSEPPRYRLLETTRRFAGEQLALHHETAPALQRHGQAMASLADQIERAFWSMGDRPWLARHAPDYDDLQAAFDRACQQRDADIAARTGLALMRLDHLRSLNAPRRRRAEALHALLPDASQHAQACIWTCIASHGLIALDVVSRLEASGQAVAAWRRLGDRARLHFALGFHAAECARGGNFDAAERALAEVRALEEPTWPPRQRAWTAAAHAGVAIHRGDAAGYRTACRDELSLAERGGAERTAAWARLKLADAALMAGDLDESIALGRIAVATLSQLDQPSNLGLALTNLCAAWILKGHDAPAREAAAQALPLMWRNGWGYLLLDALALLAVRAGLAVQAATLLGHADAWYARHGDVRQPNEATLAAHCASALAGALSAAEGEHCRAAGAQLDDDAAEALAGEVAQRLMALPGAVF